MPRRPARDPELLSAWDADGRLVITEPAGLEHCTSYDANLERVPVQALRAMCQRYSARKTTVPGSYAYEHYVRTGHVFGFGCCLGTER